MLVQILETTGEEHTIHLEEDEMEEWAEIEAVRKWLQNPDIQLYYVSSTTAVPIIAHAYYEDKGCKCTTVVKKFLSIT